MVSLNTSNLTMPVNIAGKIIKQVQTGSAVAKLSSAQPMRFGNTNLVTFTKAPKAEFVEEAGQKSSMDVGFGAVTVTPHKAQVTMRFDQEVQWADEDYQLQVLDTLADAGATALSRALDLGVFHRINPSTGQAMTSWTNYLTATDKKIASTGDPDADIEKAIGTILTDGEGHDVNGLALSKNLAFSLATKRDKQGRQLYPELGYGVDMTSFKGMNAMVTTTVNAPEAAVGSEPHVDAIVGDFANGIYWGIQKELPVERIAYGDPDGLGDLKRHNQIALRLEILYAWYVFTDRFAVITNPPTAE